jgi:hypothetical protein
MHSLPNGALWVEDEREGVEPTAKMCELLKFLERHTRRRSAAAPQIN